MSRASPMNDEQRDEIAALYRKGVTIEALMKRFKCTRTPIRTALRMRNVTMRPRGRHRLPKTRVHRAYVPATVTQADWSELP